MIFTVTTQPIGSEIAPRRNAASHYAPAAADIDTSRLEHFLGFRLTRAKMQVHRLFQRELSVLDLNATLFCVMALCAANPGCYQRQIGTALDISAPNLVPVLDRLERSGWLSRTPSAQDRRMQHLHLTAQGRGVLDQAMVRVEAFEARLEAALTPEELRMASVVLGKLTRLEWVAPTTAA